MSVNSAVETEDADQTLQALQSEHLDLYDVFPPNKQYYQDGLLHGKRKKAEVCVCVCVEGVWGVGGLGCKCGCVGVSLCTCDIRIRKWLEVGMFLEV